MEKQLLIKTVTAAQRGDVGAINTLFNEYYNDVHYFAYKTVKDAHLADDITQETFIEVIRTIKNLEAPAAFVSWLNKIAYHQCSRYFRKKRDVLAPEDENGNSPLDSIEEENSEFIPDEALEKEELRRTIMTMLDTLTEEQRSAVILRYYDELSVKEIAKIQGVSEGTVKSRLNYA